MKQLAQNEIRLDARFRGMPPEVVCAFYAWFVMRQGSGQSMTTPRRVRWIDEVLDEFDRRAVL